MSKQIYATIQKSSKIAQSYYPEQLGHLMIVNAPWAFNMAWSAIKGWIDENTRSKIQILGTNYKAELLKHIEEDQLPDFLGGTNTTPLSKEPGPWQEYRIIDGHKRGDAVGIRKKSDGPGQPVFTPMDFEALPNYLLKDPQNSVNYSKNRHE